MTGSEATDSSDGTVALTFEGRVSPDFANRVVQLSFARSALRSPTTWWWVVLLVGAVVYALASSTMRVDVFSLPFGVDSVGLGSLVAVLGSWIWPLAIAGMLAWSLVGRLQSIRKHFLRVFPPHAVIRSGITDHVLRVVCREVDVTFYFDDYDRIERRPGAIVLFHRHTGDREYIPDTGISLQAWERMADPAFH